MAPKHPTGKVKYYIAHHAVVKPYSLRIGFDAAFHHKGEIGLYEGLHA